MTTAIAFAGGGDVDDCIGGRGMLEVSLFLTVVYSCILFILTHNLLNASAGRCDNGNNTIMPDVDGLEEEGGREKGEVSLIPQIVCICFIQLYSHSLLFFYHEINTNKKESMLDAGPGSSFPSDRRRR